MFFFAPRSRGPAGRRGGRFPRVPGVAFLGVLALGMGAGSAHAQTTYFGKNKVHYQDFAWQVLESEHIELYYYPEEDSLARAALRMAEEAYGDLAARFRHEVRRKIPLIIYSSHQDFEQTNISPYFLPEGVAGFTEFLKGRVALPFNGSYPEFEHVVRHELVHVFQLSRLADSYRLHYRNTVATPPLWFIEGMAEHWSSRWDSTGDLFLSDLVLHDLLPDIPDLWRLSGTFVIYKIGQDLVGFLERRFGPDVVPLLYDELWKVNTFEGALERVTGLSRAELSARWHLDLARRYYPAVQAGEPLILAARPLAVRSGANFQPAAPAREASADGETFYFISPRSGFTDIYRASASGRERDVHRVVKGERQARFESLHGFESRISVGGDGLLAFVSKYYERDALFLYDLRREQVRGHWQFQDLVSLRSPSLSPDGSAVVFAGLTPSGRQDLYLFRFEGAELRPLTGDRYLDDDPAWSPDGKTIAFVSDRSPWGTQGARNIYRLDLASGTVAPLTEGPWKDGDPAWSPDGTRLAYASDRLGTSRILVADSSGASVPVTSFLGGALSPAWLAGGRDLVFTGMSGQEFGIYRAEAQAQGDTLPGRVPAGTDSGPRPAPGGPARAWRAAPDSLVLHASPYRRHYTLDIAQGGVAFEPTLGAVEGLQAFLSDQLGDHLMFLQLANTAQSFSDVLGRFNVGATYLNLKRRFNYGLSAFNLAADIPDELGFRTFERRVGASVIASYPYSKFLRLESTFGLLRSDRDADSFRPARDAILFTNYISLIHDNSLWFHTGPMDGARYNVTVGINANVKKVEIENISALIDLRQYFRTGLRTAYAVRLQGRISQGTLPQRFVIGGPYLLRGYPRYALVGTRAVLLNQEWRFPLLEGIVLGLPVGNLGLPPVQGALFLDVAQAWEEGVDPRKVWGSYGLGFRSSLGGFLVLRLDLAWPTDFEPLTGSSPEVDFFIGYNY